ncbi:zinc ribbon domain-containing protein [Nocardioides acrostichi]|uniref:NAD glycohydrolase translocation F5/8 type C domain-containing protein n=1 Tax=Nocardioides acrostichi TaxID=2784339 RepID=A0A930UWX7_9ACTN|nr:zinc ribbon domain-containing protein [Nocardioides acrostichi]MBF4160585.1 hypothetical protein [Nocardioides acrostichi]
MTTSCPRCGAVPDTGDGTGRFCINCGLPRGAEHTEFPTASLTPVTSSEVATATASRAGAPERRRTPAWLAGILAGLMALLLVAVLVFVVTRERGSDEGTALTTPTSSAVSSQVPTTSAPASTPPASPEDAAPTFSGDPGSLDGTASASAPEQSPDSTDLATGQRTTYDAANMLDGNPATCWRTAGDGTGLVLTFRFAQPVTLTSVGLVNGYAKTSVDGSGRRFDLYSGTRRIKRVVWIFDGGERVTQVFKRSRQVQSLDVGAVTTSTVRLKLESVSSPGGGRSARDDTAISDVSLLGYSE